MAHRSLPIIRRWLFATVSAISLLLCLATIVLWVRSYWVADTWNAQYSTATDPRLHFLLSVDGQLVYHAERLRALRSWERAHWSTHFRNRSKQHLRNLSWFEWHPTTWPATRPGDTYRAFSLIFPHWSLALLAGIMPTIWWWRLGIHRRSKRLRLGLCPTCGYDLRATPDRCPECGTLALTDTATPDH